MLEHETEPILQQHLSLRDLKGIEKYPIRNEKQSSLSKEHKPATAKIQAFGCQCIVQ